MNPGTLSRLRRRLTAYVALVLLVAVAVPAVALDRTRRARESERFDTQVTTAVHDADLLINERDDGTIDLGAYTETPRSPGAPRTAILSPGGRFLAGDGEIPEAVRRRARTLAAAAEQRVAPVEADRVRLAAVPLEGARRSLGVAVAFAETDTLRRQLRSDTLLIAALATAGWLLAVGLALLLVGRALAPAGALARREQAFLADAAHELRTPWAIVRGRAEQGLRQGPSEADLRFVRDTAGSAAATIGDMLELARLDAGEAVGERVPVALEALVATAVDERGDVADRSGVRVVRALDERVVVSGDERLLARAVGNLLDNALRHGAAGGLLEVRVIAAGSEAVVTVSDRGPGVPPGQRERIFDRFHRGSTAAPGGAGLGLPIAALVAEAHGGGLSLAAPSADGGPGASFELRLPAVS